MKNGHDVYALRSYTIKRQNGRFYIAPTQHFGEGGHKWRKKTYSSLQSATTAVARLLQNEWTDRHKWRVERGLAQE